MDNLSRKVSRKTEIESSRKMEMRKASRRWKWKFWILEILGQNYEDFRARVSNKRSPKSKKGEMFWVIGVRLLPILNENLENRWQLVLWFMVFSSFLKSRDWWFSTVFQETTLPRNYRAVEHFRCLIDALCPVVLNLSTKLNTLQHDSKSCCTHEVENVGCW